MIVQRKVAVLGDLVLALLDFGIVELLNLAALKTDEVVVVAALVEFENRAAALEMMSLQESSLFKLREYAIYGCQSDICIVVEQQFVHVFGTHVALFGALKKLEHLQPWQGCLEANALKLL